MGGSEAGSENSIGMIRRLASRPAVMGLTALGVILVVVVLVVFQPQRLLYDDVVDEAFPGTEAADRTGRDQSPSPDPVDRGAGADPDQTTGPGVDEGAVDAEDPGEETGEADDPQPVEAPSPGMDDEDMGHGSELVALGTGSFASRSRYTVTGEATAYRLEDGSRTLRLEGFNSTNGPNLYVYLTEADAGDDDAALDADFVDLGALKGNVGNQNYDIPDGVDLEHYDTVVIWCRPFKVAFGAADLG